MEKRVIAGFMLFFGFIISVVTIILIILNIVDLGEPQNSLDQAVLDEYYLSLVIQIVVTVVILVGAMSSLMGWKWTVSMVGAVLCLLSFGILFLGTLCGLVAVILLSISKDEFQPRVVYVDERAYGYGDQQGYYEEGEYYDDGGGYDAYGQQAAPAEAPPIQLVDQYGASQEHQYNEAEHRYR